MTELQNDLTTAVSGAAHWQLERDADGIAWLTLDRADASANSLSREVLEQLDQHIAALSAEPPRGLVLLSGKKSGFIAGADIKAFIGIETPEEAYELIRQGQQVLDRLEALPCPTVAAINGYALGGGLEIALACRYRVLADQDSAVLGFPEVQLGVHPGFGGTVRSIRTIGPLAAMDMMLTGRSIKPSRSLTLGLVDKVVPAAELHAAARELVLSSPKPKRAGVRDRLLNLGFVRPLLANKMRAEVGKRARRDHYPAPYALIDLWQRDGGRASSGYESEAQSMAQLLCTPTSRNLVRIFFLQERLKSQGKGAAERAQHVHVVGAGVMGGDIAAWCATRGMTVTLQDRGMEYITPALERSRKYFEKRYNDSAKLEEVSGRLTADVDGRGVSRADVVIEAIFENLEAKRDLYARLEPQMKPDAVLATNTSSIVLEQLAASLAQPHRLIGLHFFNPVTRMPLLEVIRTENSDEEMVRRGLAFARQIDKLAVVCRSAPGFLVNRVLMPYLSEAIRAAGEDIPLALIDRAAEDFGMPMGPIELADVVGLDVIMSVGKVFFDAPAAAPHVLTQLYEAKQFGKKTGQGFYTWVDDKPQKPSPKEHVMPADLQDRLMLAMVNEAMAVLREGVVEDAELVDAGVIFGAGFAPFRGGPLQYARSRGIDSVTARLKELERRYGPRFTPDPGWANFQ